jgi:hypothetical protein
MTEITRSNRFQSLRRQFAAPITRIAMYREEKPNMNGTARSLVRLIAVALFCGVLITGRPAAAQTWNPTVLFQASNSLSVVSGLDATVGYSGGDVVAVNYDQNDEMHWFTFALSNTTVDPINNGTFGFGQYPSVSVSGNNVLVVYTITSGEMYYRAGTLSNGTIDWYGASGPYDKGFYPCVSLYGNDLVEVHSGYGKGSPDGTLWIRTGTLSDGTIAWNNSGRSAQYDTGYNPKVSLFNGIIVEVHSGHTTAKLWYCTGDFSYAPPYVTDQGSYTTTSQGGCYPSVSLYGDSVVEVHEGGSTSEPTAWVYYLTGTLVATETASGTKLTVNWGNNDDPTAFDVALGNNYGTQSPCVSLFGNTAVEVNGLGSGSADSVQSGTGF